MRLRYGMNPQQATASATPVVPDSRHGVTRIAEPGGSIRSGEVAAACEEYGITLARTGLRLFHH
jgi:AICAR transformylase/IMP cyclohydrolase PurH